MTADRADRTAIHTLTADWTELVDGHDRWSFSVVHINVLSEQPHIKTKTHSGTQTHSLSNRIQDISNTADRASLYFRSVIECTGRPTYNHYKHTIPLQFTFSICV